MPCSIRSSARAWHRGFLAEIAHVATERPLIDSPILSTMENGIPACSSSRTVGHGLTAHVLDRILIAEPIRPFDRIGTYAIANLSSPRLPRLAAMPPLGGYRVTAV